MSLPSLTWRYNPHPTGWQPGADQQQLRTHLSFSVLNAFACCSFMTLLSSHSSSPLRRHARFQDFPNSTSTTWDFLLAWRLRCCRSPWSARRPRSARRPFFGELMTAIWAAWRQKTPDRLHGSSAFRTRFAYGSFGWSEAHRSFLLFNIGYNGFAARRTAHHEDTSVSHIASQPAFQRISIERSSGHGRHVATTRKCRAQFVQFARRCASRRNGEWYKLKYRKHVTVSLGV